MKEVVLREGDVYLFDEVRELTALVCDGSPLCIPVGEGSRGSKVRKFRLQFVGVVGAGDNLFICLPKFMQNVSRVEPAALQKILRAIMVHGGGARVFSTFGLGYDADGPDLFTVGRFLVEHYARYGNYWTDELVRTSQGVWDVDWGRTIAMRVPMLQSGVPIYEDFIMQRRSKDERGLVARLHASVVGEFSLWLRRSGVGQALGIPLPAVRAENIEDLGDISFLVARVDVELSQQFVTWKKHALEAVSDYLRLRGNRFGESPVIMGTCRFEYVWEAACAFSLENCVDVELSGRPEWVYFPDMPGSGAGESNKEVVNLAAGGGLRPDWLSVSGSGVYVFDAKYYVPTFGSQVIQKAPGVADLVKQYFYQLALYVVASRRSMRVAGNALVFPAILPAGCLVRCRGSVRFSFLDALSVSVFEGESVGFDSIRLIELDAFAILEGYADRRPCGSLDLDRIFGLETSDCIEFVTG